MKRQIQHIVTAFVLAFSAGGATAAGLDDLVAALEAAAANGDPKAQTDLAVRYEHAEGVAKDFQKANMLYCRAARQGYPEGQFKLGWVYANGRGVPRDDGVAAALFIMAAEQGHPHAAKLLTVVRQQPGTQLPSCLLPEPLAPVRTAMIEEPVVASVGRNRGEIEQLVRRLAPEYEIDSQLVMALISAESSFNPTAVSPKNAQGLMQLIPETAARFGVKKILNPADNIKGGLAYLRWLLAFFEGDVALVLAAYNAGERAVEKYRGIPPYPETRDYVRKITGVYKKAIHPYVREVVEPSAVMGRVKRAQS